MRPPWETYRCAAYARAALGEAAHLQLGLTQSLQYGLGVRQQGFAEFGQRGPARPALDEPGTEVGFQG